MDPNEPKISAFQGYKRLILLGVGAGSLLYFGQEIPAGEELPAQMQALKDLLMAAIVGFSVSDGAKYAGEAFGKAKNGRGVAP